MSTSAVPSKVIYSQGSALQNETFFYPCEYRTTKFYAPLMQFVAIFQSSEAWKTYWPVEWGTYYPFKTGSGTEDFPRGAELTWCLVSGFKI